MMLRLAVGAFALLTCGCQPGTESPEKPAIPDAAEHLPWSGIGPQETLNFTGTEPFWGGQVASGTLIWKTPENQAGTTIRVERFAGRNGLGFNGALANAPFDMAVSEAECSDGMSDRTYPFTVMVRYAGQTLSGCGWTDARPYSGASNP